MSRLSRAVILILALSWLALVAFAWGDAQAAESENEYSFRWLDPDKKIYVLQNRKYTKAFRPQLSVMGGLGFSNAYRNTYNIDPRLTFYFTEMFGIEAFYAFTFNQQNAAFQALVNTGSSVLPVVREINSAMGGMLHFTPWYAKINVFNAILYFDWYFAAGAGMITSNAINPSTNGTGGTTPQNLFAIYAATGHYYNISKYFLVRVDFKGTFYNAPIFGTTGTNAFFSNYDIGLGLGLKI